MSEPRVLVFPTRLDSYKETADEKYLCALLPGEVDYVASVEWGLEKDSSDIWFLSGRPTEDEGRLIRSAQPTPDAKSKYRVAIPPEFYRNRDSSPVYEMEKGDDVIFEIVDDEDPHFRIYDPDDYPVRQQSVQPEIKAPVVAGGIYGTYKFFSKYFGTPRILNVDFERVSSDEYQLQVECDREVSEEISCRLSENERLSTIDRAMQRNEADKREFTYSLNEDELEDEYYVGLLRDGLPVSEPVKVPTRTGIVGKIKNYLFGSSSD